ncbi:MAG: BCSC C-terminal domain-containing protein [Nitrospirae bacterium]|nr:BCSC C-terminal domain-containing protein [Nitrospirota bacterium]
MITLIRIMAIYIALCLISPVLAADNTESGQGNVLKVIRKQHDVSVKTVPHQDYVGSEEPPSVTEKRPQAVKKPKHKPVREAAKRPPEKMSEDKKAAAAETFQDADLPEEVRSSQGEKEIERLQTVEDKNSSGPSEPQVSLLKKRFLEAAKDSAVYFETGEDILDIEPSNVEIRSALAWSCFDEKNYECALRHFEILSRDNRGNRDYLKGMAWTYFRQEKYDQALNLFKELYTADKSPEAASNLKLAFENLNADDQAKILSDLQEEQEPVLLKMAADRHYENNAPMTASYIYDGEETCYRNCSSPVLDFSGYYRNKSGDSGLSKLNEFSFPLKLHYPVRAGKEWVVSITPIYLNSGDAPSAVYAGHYFRYIHDSSAKQRDLTDSATVYEPEIRYRTEGPVEKEFMLGTTPLNGIAGPMPRFMAKIAKKDHWFIQLSQDSVRESILSYTGLRDPYGNKKWGRVLKTGAGAGMTFALFSPYWVSFDAGYDYYWGENITGNYSVSGTLSAGRTDRILKGEANAGMFLTSRHYDKNTAFFTFGHGGYYSPDIFLIAGPFVRYKTEACKDFWFDGEVSAGYLYFRTEDAPHYPKADDSAALLNSAAQTDLSGEYEGEKKSTVGLSLKLKAVKLIHDNIGVGAYLHGNNSADFNEFSAGLVVQYYFEPMKKISHTWDMLQGM